MAAGTSPAAEPVPSEPDGVEAIRDRLQWFHSWQHIGSDLQPGTRTYGHRAELIEIGDTLLAALDAERRRCAALRAANERLKKAVLASYQDWTEEQFRAIQQHVAKLHGDDTTARPGGGALSGEG